ncbi:MAG: hypothetical protein R3C49_00840 [Planctomycetaceae bacterium]
MNVSTVRQFLSRRLLCTRRRRGSAHAFRLLSAEVLEVRSLLSSVTVAGVDEGRVAVQQMPAVSAAVDAQLAAPQSVASTTEGQYTTFFWEPVEGATGYDLWLVRTGASSETVAQLTVSDPIYSLPFDFQIGRYRLWVRATGGTAAPSPGLQELEFSTAGLAPIS